MSLVMRRKRDAVDSWTIQQETRLFPALYSQLSQQLKRAYKRGGLDAVIRTYNERAQSLHDRQLSLITRVVRRATGDASKAFEDEVSKKYGRKLLSAEAMYAAADPLPPSTTPVPGSTKSPAMIIQEILTLPDDFGSTLSERIWRNSRETRNELTNFLQGYVSDYADFRQATRTLLSMQLDDPRLPQHIQRLIREARRALKTQPTERDEFLRILKQSKEYVEKLTPGERGTRGFQRRTLQRINKAVREGDEAGIGQAIEKFIERRARYRSQVLLRSAGQRAFQESSLATFDKYNFVQAVRWRLSPRHKDFDECDLKSRANIGLGPGVYYKKNVPWPDHPNGTCWLEPVLSSIHEVDTAQTFAPESEALARQATEKIRGPLARQANRLGRKSGGLKKNETEDLLNQVPVVDRVPLS